MKNLSRQNNQRKINNAIENLNLSEKYQPLINKEKPELPGCKERFNLTFLKYVISYNKKKRPEVKKILSVYSDNKILIFRKQKDLNKWLKNFTEDESLLSKYI